MSNTRKKPARTRNCAIQAFKDHEELCKKKAGCTRHKFKRGETVRIFADGLRYNDIFDSLEITCTKCGFSKLREPIKLVKSNQGAQGR